MLVAALPLVPHEGDKCWAFYVINDGDEVIESVRVDTVDYEWGDQGNSETVGSEHGPVPPGRYLEVYRETSTEVRTGLTLTVRTVRGSERHYVQFGRLYSPASSKLEPIPIVGRAGKLPLSE